MSSVPVIATGEAPVISMDNESSLMFEDCVAKLTAIVDRSGQPLNEMSHHPAVAPILRKMRSLVHRMDCDASAGEDNEDGSLATVTDIS
jgi:hypothetical protein